ncbi:tetratricopeptide repeat protein [Paenibacillus antibioticophila]|nr:tetratricopeptide repeat protein [Paenibacillus antibioticophila]
MDAGFFFERAVSSLDRRHYDKALKYFRKAAEYEPQNPVNHCNLAGILSEMGDFEASNAALSIVLDEIDPNMTECYFYMANNYANMNMFEAAEQALVTYLERDASGQFLEEAEEMMDLLQFELERPTKVTSIKAMEGVVEHDRARLWLEEGKFVQAVKLLEEIVEKQPDFHSARNNLALGYYYLGRFQKALDMVEEVLQQEPGNLHALCNLAIFSQHVGDQEALDALSGRLGKIVPFHQEHVFKLATTMGILGDHEAAYSHFLRLLREEDIVPEPSLYHYAATAAFYTGRFQAAEKLWRQAKSLDPASKVAEYYLEWLSLFQEELGRDKEETETSRSSVPVISYQYQLPFEEQMKHWEGSEEGLTEDLLANPLVRASCFWALRHGDDHVKLQVIEAFRHIADHEAELELRAFLQNPDEDPQLKETARFVLRNWSAEQEYAASKRERELAGALQGESHRLPVWKVEWQAVLDLVSLRNKEEFDAEKLQDLKSLWIEFLDSMYPNVPEIKHLEGWAAALAYLVAKLHNLPLTYKVLAERYAVTASLIRRYVERIDEVCAVKKRLKPNFPFVQ